MHSAARSWGWDGSFLIASIYELNDNRFLGCAIAEITGFPPEDSEDGTKEHAVQQNAAAFQQAIQEFYQLGSDASSCAELLWIPVPAEQQVIRSRIRLFLVLRKIGPVQESVRADLESMQSSFRTILTSQHYEMADVSIEDGMQELIAGIDTSCTYALIKRDNVVAGVGSPFPYYYCDVLPSKSADSFSALIAILCQSEHCALSFQLFPSGFSSDEKVYLNNQASALSQIASGFMNAGQMFRDDTAATPAKVMSYYAARENSALFQYNILVFGGQRTCGSIAARTLSLLKSGTEEVAPAEIGCIDLTNERIDLATQLSYYPWNINTKLMYAYRNREILQSYGNAAMLQRMPYLMTAEEAVTFFRLPLRAADSAALPEVHSGRGQELFLSSITSEDSIRFGTLVGSSNLPIGAPEKLFTKHALIVGTPGSGKTTFAVNLLLQFAEKGIPFLAIEPTKTEYRAMIDAIPDLQIFTPGNNAVSPFILNPFLPPRNIRLEQYMPSLMSAFQAAFSMPSPLDVLFLKAIRSCYVEHGWKDYSKAGDADVTPFGMYEFILCFRRLIASSNYSREVKGNLESGGVYRLMNLIEQNRNIYDTDQSVPIEDLLGSSTVLELNAIENSEQKALIMALLLIQICLYTKNNQAGDGKLKNVILIDEAHVLLGGQASGDSDKANAQQTTVKALQDMIAEIRSYGTSMVIADQAPTKVSREIVANTDIKICFRLVQTTEKELIADSTNMGPKEVENLSRLRPGEAYVYNSLLESPQLIQTDDIRADKGIRLAVSNDEVVSRMHYWDSRKTMLRPYRLCASCRECQKGCDAAIRAQAGYYAAKICGDRLGGEKDPKVVFKYILETGKILRGVAAKMPAHAARRLVDCCRIQIARKAALGGGPEMPQRSMVKLLTREPDSPERT